MKMDEDRKLMDSMDIYVDPDKKKKALAAVEKAVSKKVIRYSPSFWEILRIQMQYISRVYWIVQACCVLAFVFLFYQMGSGDADIYDYVLWFSIGASLLGLAGISELGSHFSCRTAEIEQSCYLNLKQLWSIKMILFGGADILILSLFSGGIVWRTEMRFTQVCIYLLVPFLLSNLCYLLTLSAFRGGTGKYVRLGLALVMGLGAAAPSLYPASYKAQFLWVWALVLAAAVILLVLEIRGLLGKLTKGDILCWN